MLGRFTKANGPDPHLHAFAHRMQMQLIDFGNGLAHAEAMLPPRFKTAS